MAAIIPTQRAPKSLEDLKYHLNRDNKVKVAGRVIMCVLRPILTHLVTQGSMVGFDLTSDPMSDHEQWMGFCAESLW